QTASVALNTPVRSGNGVRVPLQALIQLEGRSAVWVLDGSTMTVKAVPVVTADITGNVVLVSQGLKPGMEIVTAGVHVLQPEQKVTRYQDPGRPQAPVATSQSASQPWCRREPDLTSPEKTPAEQHHVSRGFSLSRWALEHKALTRYLMVVLMVLGLASYFQLGQDEDPPFAFRAMVVQAYWPGATAQQVA